MSAAKVDEKGRRLLLLGAYAVLFTRCAQRSRLPCAKLSEPRAACTQVLHRHLPFGLLHSGRDGDGDQRYVQRRHLRRVPDGHGHHVPIRFAGARTPYRLAHATCPKSGLADVRVRVHTWTACMHACCMWHVACARKYASDAAAKVPTPERSQQPCAPCAVAGDPLAWWSARRVLWPRVHGVPHPLL
eukprot:3337301-Prymnesium_polylepis.3